MFLIYLTIKTYRNTNYSQATWGKNFRTFPEIESRHLISNVSEINLFSSKLHRTSPHNSTLTNQVLNNSGSLNLHVKADWNSFFLKLLSLSVLLINFPISQVKFGRLFRMNIHVIQLILRGDAYQILKLHYPATSASKMEWSGLKCNQHTPSNKKQHQEQEDKLLIF